MRLFMVDWISFSCFSSVLIWILNVRNLLGLDAGCFPDCYTSGQNYSGIRSVLRDGRVCRDWKDTRHAARQDLKANLCTSIYQSRPGCYTPNNNFDYCEIPDCSTRSARECVGILNKERNATSVTIKWSSHPNLGPLHGYLVLLHNNNRFCEQAIIQLCNTCVNFFGSQINNLYRSCKIKSEGSPIKHEVTFTGLEKNRKYNVYITPLLGFSRLAYIRNIIVLTQSLEKPQPPISVTYQMDTIRSIKILWLKNGPAQGYVAHITNKNNGKRNSMTINTESVTFSDLEMCTEYCFVVSSYNGAGKSDYTKEVCTFTLAPKTERSDLADPPSGYMKIVSLSWTYSGTDDCRKVYLVEYRVKFLEDSALHFTTNITSLVVTGLRPNVIYTVRVRAEGQMKTVNNENIGEFSVVKEFYTGKSPPNLLYFQQNLEHTNKVLNISWGIEKEIQGSIFMYIIQVKNFAKFCMYSVLLTCQKCKEPWTWKNLSPQYKESLETMKCSTSLPDKMDGDQTSFNYLLKFEKEFTNLSVELYGVNLMGIHVLKEMDTIIPTPTLIPSTPFRMPISWIIAISVLVVFLFSICLVIGLRCRKKNVKKEESYVMNNIDKLEKLKNKILISLFPSYVEKVSKYGSAELIKQFKKLTKFAKTQETALRLTVFDGNESANFKRNRFVNIVPYDQNRVKVELRTPPLDYINASYIPFENHENQVEYIAAQEPIECTLSDFWQMIWEQNIHHIVMLTKREKHRVKYLQYWPMDTNQSLSYGNLSQFEVTLVRQDVYDAYIERELKVVNTITSESHNLTQLQMYGWSDHSTPKFDCLMEFFVRFHEITNEHTSNPYLVHCIDGVGATGTFICIDRIIKQLVSGIQMISIFSTILKLREYRMFMVQRQTQYIFIHKYINHFLEKFMKIEHVNDQDYDY